MNKDLSGSGGCRLRFAKHNLALLCFSIFVSIAGATNISTDQKDYWLGSTAIISGKGFTAGENVQVQVLHADGRVDTNADHYPWLVTADASGTFTTSWCVCDTDNEGSTLIVTAMGLASGLQASTTFTDSGVDFSQYINGNYGTNDSAWVGGAINANKAFYAEGMCVPQRLFLLGLSPSTNNTHTLQLKVLATKGGVHAYDFLTSWEQAVLTANFIDPTFTLMG